MTLDDVINAKMSQERNYVTRRILRRNKPRENIFSIFCNNELVLKLNENLWCMIMKIFYL